MDLFGVIMSKVFTTNYFIEKMHALLNVNIVVANKLLYKLKVVFFILLAIAMVLEILKQ